MNDAKRVHVSKRRGRLVHDRRGARLAEGPLLTQHLECALARMLKNNVPLFGVLEAIDEGDDMRMVTEQPQNGELMHHKRLRLQNLDSKGPAVLLRSPYRRKLSFAKFWTKLILAAARGGLARRVRDAHGVRVRGAAGTLAGALMRSRHQDFLARSSLTHLADAPGGSMDGCFH